MTYSVKSLTFKDYCFVLEQVKRELGTRAGKEIKRGVAAEMKKTRAQ